MSSAAEEPWEQPSGEAEYGPSSNEIEVWDASSNYARIRSMRLEGKTVPQISAALNISPSTVKQSLTNQLKMEAAKLDAEEMSSILSLEMERLDHMVQGYWYAAQAGDIDAAKLMLQVGRERREWLKWAQPEPTADLGITNNILVVGGSESEFLQSLQAARDYLETQGGQSATYEDAEVVADEPHDA